MIINIDKANPTVTVTVLSVNDSLMATVLNAITGIFFYEAQVIVVDADDTGSGLASVTVECINGDESTELDPIVGLSNQYSIPDKFEGYIKVTATDKAGNKGELDTTPHKVRVDSAGIDVTGFAIDSDGYNSSLWSKDPVTLKLYGVTAITGIEKYMYSTDNGDTWSDCTGADKDTVEIGAEGITTLIFKVVTKVDSAGVAREVSLDGSYTVMIDKTAPVSDISLKAVAAGAQAGYYNSSNGADIFTITPDTSGAPVTSYYRIGTVTTNFTENGYPTGLTDGSYTVYAYDVNIAGTGPEDSVSFVVDTLAPSVSSAVLTAEGASYIPGTWTNKNVTATVNATDANGGLEYKFGTGSFQISNSYTLMSNYNGTLNIEVRDKAGNITPHTSDTIRIDKTAPSVTINSVNKVSNTTVVSFTASDSGGSGIASFLIKGYKNSTLYDTTTVNKTGETSYTATLEQNNLTNISVTVTDNAGNETVSGYTGTSAFISGEEESNISLGAQQTLTKTRRNMSGRTISSGTLRRMQVRILRRSSL
jgi:hypothetical protein